MDLQSFLQSSILSLGAVHHVLCQMYLIATLELEQLELRLAPNNALFLEDDNDFEVAIEWKTFEIELILFQLQLVNANAVHLI